MNNDTSVQLFYRNINFRQKHLWFLQENYKILLFII